MSIALEDDIGEAEGPIWAGMTPDMLTKEQLDILRVWEPKTKLGRLVHSGQITDIEAIFTRRLRIMEHEIVDLLMPDLDDDIIKVNMVQRMTDSGRRVRFYVMACVGNRDGYVGLGITKGKEVASTIRKSINAAKLNLIPVLRGNGSWESSSGVGRSIPIEITGRCGSTRITLKPAPEGKGLVIGEIGQRVLSLAGISDVWSHSKGQTRTRINFARAVFNALKKLNKVKINPSHHEKLNIIRGRMNT